MAYRFAALQGILPSAGLARELSDRDARLLLDIGLVRGEDGSLRLAEDPAQALGVPTRRHAGGAVVARLRAWFLHRQAARC